MQLSPTMKLLFFGAALLVSTPSSVHGATGRKLRGRQSNIEGAVSNDSSVDDGTTTDQFSLAGGRDTQQRRAMEFAVIGHWMHEEEELSPGTPCGKKTTPPLCDNCEGGQYSWWYGKVSYACGFEPDWEDGTRCAAGTTCNACKDDYWEYWDSLAFTACGKEPKWEDGARCAAGTTCDNNCKDGYYEFWDGLAFTACGKEPKWVDGTRCWAGTTCDNRCIDGYYEYWDSKAYTACGREPCWEDGAYCAAGTTCNQCCNSWHYNTKWAWTLCGESY